jgi:hypothetical protein
LAQFSPHVKHTPILGARVCALLDEGAEGDMPHASVVAEGLARLIGAAP